MRPALLLLAPLAAGCFHAPAADSAGGDASADDTGVPTDDTGETGSDSGEDSGGGPSGAFSRVDVHVSTGTATVIVVDWDSPGAVDAAWVEYGPTTAYGSVAPARDSQPPRAVLLGTPPGETIHLRVAAVVAGETLYSDDLTATAGALPTNLPAFTVTDTSGGAPFGEYVLTGWFAAGPGESGVVILDRAGDVVWYSTPVEGFMPAARPSRDGESILYLVYDDVTHADHAQICRADLDGEHTTCLDTPYCHHDFVELADGDLACIEEVADTWEDYALVGDAVTVWHAGGGSTRLWNAFDHITPVYSKEWTEHLMPRGADWTHGNGLWYDEAEDAWYLSFYYFGAIYKIPGAGGPQEWVFGGDQSDFTLDGEPFGPQHAPQWDAATSTLYLFDNAESGEGGSRAASFQLDTTTWTATEVQSWRHANGRRAAVLGDNHFLPSGYVATAWGDVGEVRVHDPSGATVWEVAFTPGTSVTQAYTYDDLYTMAPN